MTAGPRMRVRGGTWGRATRRLLATILTAQVAYTVLCAPASALPPAHRPQPETPATTSALARAALQPSAPSGGIGHGGMPHRHTWRVAPSEADPGSGRVTADDAFAGAAVVPGSISGPDRASAPATTLGMLSLDRYASSASRTRGQPASA